MIFLLIQGWLAKRNIRYLVNELTCGHCLGYPDGIWAVSANCAYYSLFCLITKTAYFVTVSLNFLSSHLAILKRGCYININYKELCDDIYCVYQA